MKKILVTLIFAVYCSLNWGGLVLHRHAWSSPGKETTAFALQTGSGQNCPVCQWETQNISDAPFSVSFYFSFIEQAYNPLDLALYSGFQPKKSLTARAPPAA